MDDQKKFYKKLFSGVDCSEEIKQKVITKQTMGANKERVRFKYVYSLAGVIVLALIIIYGLEKNQHIGDDKTLVESTQDTHSATKEFNKGKSIEQGSGGEKSDDRENIKETLVYVINDMNNSQEDNIRVHYDPDKTYRQELTYPEVVKYLGIDVEKLEMPMELQLVNKASSYEIIRNNDDSVAMDDFIFIFKGADDANRKEVRMILSKKKGYNDAPTVKKEDMVPTTINDRQVILGHKTDATGQDIYVAEFKINDIEAELITQHLSEVEYIQLISYITSLK